MAHHPLGDGRYLVRLDPGEEIVARLRDLAAAWGATAGWIQGIGSVSDILLGFLDPETGEYVKRRFQEPMEVANLSGSISVDGKDGSPFVHVHATVSPRELLAYAGHVHEATVGAVMEIFVTTVDARVERHPRADVPFPWPVLPGEDAE